jgi:hypothetical protein
VIRLNFPVAGVFQESVNQSVVSTKAGLDDVDRIVSLPGEKHERFRFGRLLQVGRNR